LLLVNKTPWFLATNIKTINSVSILGSGNIVLALHRFACIYNKHNYFNFRRASVSGDVTISSTLMQPKVELFWASAAYNETLKDLV
jgi:hypothetical protein